MACCLPNTTTTISSTSTLLHLPSQHNHRSPSSLKIFGRWTSSPSTSPFAFTPTTTSSTTTHKSATGLVLSNSTRPREIVRVVIEENLLEQDTTGGDGGFGKGGEDGGGGGDGGGGDDGKNKEDEGGDSDKNKKLAMSMAQKLTLAYAALVGVGGVMGYVKGGSQKSLAAGGLSALLLYYVYTQLPVRPTFASSLGLGLSVALLGVMGSRYKKSGKVLPAGVVSFVSLVMAGGYLHGILRKVHA